MVAVAIRDPAFIELLDYLSTAVFTLREYARRLDWPVLADSPLALRIAMYMSG